MENSFWIPTTISLVSLFWNYFQSRKILNLETEAQRKTLIHKFQFEKEFTIYSELWAKLVDLRNSTLALRPSGELIDPSKTNEERRVEKLKFVWQMMYELCETFEKNRPFYAKEVHKEIDEMIKVSKFEAVNFQHGDNRNRQYWEDAESSAKKIVESMEKLSNMIRKRIEIVETKL
mgnify:CR=1 FL=1